MKYLTLFFFSFICIFTYAQYKQFSNNIDWRGSSVSLHTVVNNSLGCTYVIGKDSIKAFLHDTNSGSSELFTFKRRANEKFLGSFVKNSRIYLFLDNAKQKGLHSWSYDMLTKNIQENVVPFKIADQLIVARLSSNSYFFYVTIDRKNSSLDIYKFSDHEHFELTRHLIDQKLLKKVFDDRDRISGQLDIAFVDMAGECDIDKAKSKSKLYLRNDSLLFLLNVEKAITDVYSIDLATNSLSHRSIIHNISELSEKNSVDNSFLLNEKLFYAFATSDQLIIQVNDFYSGKKLKEFRAKGQEDISFKNTPIIQNGTFLLPEFRREIADTKQMLRKMTNGQMAISAIQDDNLETYVLTVGAYKLFENNFSTPTAFETKSFGNTGEANFGPGNFSRNSWSKSTFFKCLFNIQTIAHIDGTIPVTINDKVEADTKKLKIPPEGENLFVLNNNYYYAFYNNDTRSITVFKY